MAALPDAGRPRPPQWFERPIHWEPTLSFLRSSVGFLVLGALIVLVALRLLAPEQEMRLRMVATLLAIGLVAGFLLRFHKVHAALWLLAFGVWSYLTVASYFFGGVDAVAILLFPLLILMCGWIVGARAAMALAVLTSLITLGYVVGDAYQLMPPPLPTPPLMRWVIETCVFLLSAVLIADFTRSYRSRLAEVHALGVDLALRNEEVRSRESDLNRAQEVAHVGSWVYDLATDVMQLSPETCRIFGLPEGTLGSRETYLSRVHPGDHDGVRAAWDEAVASGTPFVSEHPILARRGVRRVHQRAEFQFRADGSAHRSVGTTQDVTDQRAAEEALRTSEAQLECILASTSEGILAVAQDGTVIRTNKRFAELWQVPPALLESRNDAALLAFVVDQVSDSAGFLASVQELYSSDLEITDFIAFKDGRSFERFTAPLLQNGKTTGRVWSFRDITARRRIEDRLEMAIEITGLVYFELDFIRDRLVFDSVALRRLGLHEVPRMQTLDGWIASVHPDDQPAFHASLAKALEASRPPFDCEYRMLGPDGAWEWLHSRARITQQTDDGRPMLAVGTSINITERKRGEALLRASEETSRRLATMLRLMCDNVPDMIWAKDLEGRYLFTNKAVCTHLLRARDTEEPIGKTERWFADRLRTEHPGNDLWHTFGEAGERTDVMTLECGASVAFEDSGRADGKRLSLEVHKAPFQDEHGRVIGTVGSARDITERKRLEEVHLQAQKLASLGTLAGGIAHDFNNILTAIRGYASLAAEEMGPAHPASDSVGEILRSTERASELVRRIMTFGRPKEAHPGPVDLEQVSQEVLKLLRSTLPASIELITDFAPGAPHVLADAGQVHEALVNLTTNAVHAVGRRPGWVRYGTSPVAVNDALARTIPGLRPGRYVRLTVSDNGCGMDAATQLRVFDAFYTTKPVGEGTGLGLSMVHGIMRGHAGAVTVESTAGEGSTFTLYLPVAEQPASTVHSVTTVQRELRTGLRVLYVDDEQVLVSLASRMLARQGHTVSGFTDPVKTLQAFTASPQAWDAVVTDLSMPRMSGMELARELVAVRPDVVVLMTTGRISDEDRGAARDAGVRELILKPFTSEQLAHALDRLVPRAGGH